MLLLAAPRAAPRRRRASATPCCASASAVPPPPSQPQSGRAYVPSGFMFVEADDTTPGERVRVEVGPVGERKRTTFVLPLLCGAPSTLIAVTLPRPLGVVFVPDAAGGVRVGSLVPGSVAGRAGAVARLSPDGMATPRPGDVLRAVTATVFAFTPQCAPPGEHARPATHTHAHPLRRTRSKTQQPLSRAHACPNCCHAPRRTRRAQLLGDLKGTKRTVVLYGADGQAWQKSFAALTQGMAADGPVTLVLERPLPGSADATWAPLPVSPADVAATWSEEERALRQALPPLVYGGDEEEEEDAGEAAAAAREQARRAAQLHVEGPGSEVSAAFGSTAVLLVLLLAAGFFP
jgi:hypothetical protein